MQSPRCSGRFQVFIGHTKKCLQVVSLPFRITTDLINDVGTQHPITFELRFAEELITGSFMREVLIDGGVVVNIYGFVAVKSRLNVKQSAVFSAFVNTCVANLADGAILPGFLTFSWKYETALHLDGNPKVDSNFANRVPEIVARKPRICAGIDGHDQVAAPTDHLVKTEIFKMAAIRKVHIWTGIVGHSERFSQDCSE